MFELALSSAGIDFVRPERAGATLTWDRVSEWKVEARADEVVLTLCAGGTSTPLLVPGWSAAELDALCRQLAEDAAVSAESSEPAEPAVTGRSSVRRARRSRRWKVVLTVALLAVLATAVTIVLLQSAGVISWSILGPTS